MNTLATVSAPCPSSPHHISGHACAGPNKSNAMSVAVPVAPGGLRHSKRNSPASATACWGKRRSPASRNCDCDASPLSLHGGVCGIIKHGDRRLWLCSSQSQRPAGAVAQAQSAPVCAYRLNKQHLQRPKRVTTCAASAAAFHAVEKHLPPRQWVRNTSVAQVPSRPPERQRGPGRAPTIVIRPPDRPWRREVRRGFISHWPLSSVPLL